MRTKLLAIDPGQKGGLAVMDLTEHKIIAVTKMPATPTDLLDFITRYGVDVCYLEKVGGMPGQSGSAMFNFGKGFGHIEMALLALHIPTVTVTPQKWQKHFQLGSSKGKTKTEWKNILKAKSQQLYPNIKVTLDIADALLIAEYGYSEEK